MNRWYGAVISAMVMAVAGCGAQTPNAATPRAAFELAKAAVADKHFEDLWGMLSAAGRQQMNDDAAAIAEKARAASKAEGPGRVALEMEVRSNDLSMEDMKHLDGKKLFVADLKIAAQNGKAEWDSLQRAEFSRAEEDPDGRHARVYFKIDASEQRDRPMLLVREDGSWKIDLPAAAPQSR